MVFGGKPNCIRLLAMTWSFLSRNYDRYIYIHVLNLTPCTLIDVCINTGPKETNRRHNTHWRFYSRVCSNSWNKHKKPDLAPPVILGKVATSQTMAYPTIVLTVKTKHGDVLTVHCRMAGLTLKLQFSSSYWSGLCCMIDQKHKTEPLRHKPNWES